MGMPNSITERTSLFRFDIVFTPWFDIDGVADAEDDDGGMAGVGGDDIMEPPPTAEFIAGVTAGDGMLSAC